MKSSLSLLIAASLMLAACATFDAEKTHKIRKLAILAIEIQQQQPTDNLGIKKLSEFKERIGDSAELQDMAKNVFGDLSKQLEGKTGWKVLSLSAMQANPAYAGKVKAAMSGARLVSMTGKGYEIVALKGELDAMAFRRMSQEERVKLARSLGVDAFATVQIYMQIDQAWLSFGHLSGDARFSFQARSNMDVYDLESDKPIWRIQNVDGDQTAKSDSLDKSLSVRSKLAQLGQTAASTSISKLVNNYR